jgi:hypothetical protein
VKTVFNTIPAALIARYRAGAFFTDARTAYANAEFAKPGTSIAWAAVFAIPAQTEILSITDTDEMAGVFQIDINYPQNTGAGSAQAMADSIRAWFKRGTVLDGVHLGAVSVTPGAVVDGWYRVSVSVLYRAFVAV